MTRIIAHVSALRPAKDSVNWAAIPVGTPLVAGYVAPSRFAWPPAAWARFTGSTLVRITPSVATTGVGIHVLDIEAGDATPAQAPGWVRVQRALGQEPTLYSSIWNWPAVIRAINAASLTHPPYWVAGYPGGGAVLPSIVVDGQTYTAVAHQYADPNTSGGDYDLSVVADYWPGVDGGDMPLTIADAQLVVQELLNWYIDTPHAPAGTAGRQVWDVLGDGERVLTAVAGVSSALDVVDTDVKAVDKDVLAATTTLTAAIHAQPTGGQVDVPTLVTDLAGPLATALGPLLPADTTPAQLFTALAAQLTLTK